LGLPVLGFSGLVAIAPPLPQALSRHPSPGAAPSSGVFRYLPDDEAFALDFDPRQVGFDLYMGWDREKQAYADRSALAFVSGPMYERYGAADGSESVVPLGDLKLEHRIWRGRNRTAARQRAFLGIRHDGRVEFGYGELTPPRVERYDTFIGGLHSVYNDLESAPSEYRGAYSISMGQQIRYYLPRIRLVYGLRSDGRLAVLMSRDGLTLEQTKALARDHGFVAAYLPDHASKSRFIVPGTKDFSEADANWISGGATSFVHVPYMLRLRRRSIPLQGSLLNGLAPLLPERFCSGPLQCGPTLGAQLLDRALAGFNRLMEEGVEPVARLLWAPKGPKLAGRNVQAAPLREPVITADPRSMQLRQERDLSSRHDALPPPPPTLPPADTLPDAVELPPPPGEGEAPDPADLPAAEAGPVSLPKQARPDLPAGLPPVTAAEVTPTPVPQTAPGAATLPPQAP
jgi:hypothetical protein